MQFERPGCFGFVASYNVKSAVCQACEFNQDCAATSKNSLSELAQKLNVDAVRRLMHNEAKQTVAKKTKTNTPVQTSNPIRDKILAGMSAHVARAAGMILDAGVSHRASLLNGVNSMKGRKPASIEVLFDLLLQGPVTRVSYLEALQERLGYTHATASSQASIGLTAVTGIGIAKDAGDGSIIIRGEK